MVDLGNQTLMRLFLSDILLDIKQERVIPNPLPPGLLWVAQL